MKSATLTLALSSLLFLSACTSTPQGQAEAEPTATSTTPTGPSSAETTAQPSASKQPTTSGTPAPSAQASALPSRIPVVTENGAVIDPQAPAANPTLASTPAPQTSTSPSQPTASAAAEPAGLAMHSLADGSRVGTALSPTGNIACEIYTDRAQCSVLSLGESAPRTPGQVTVPGWSYAVTASGQVYDTGLSQAPLSTLEAYRGKILPYGTTVTYGQFSLTSSEDGITLRDTASGHGATYSRAGITTF